MKTEKRSSVPASGRRALRFPVRDWQNPSLTHMRIQGDALVCGEKLTYETGINSTDDHLYESAKDGYYTMYGGDGVLYLRSTNRGYATTVYGDVFGALTVPDWNGGMHEYLAMYNGIIEYEVFAGGRITLTEKGGSKFTSIALFRERLFGANGTKLYWSATAKEDYSFSPTDAQGAGNVSLPDAEAGNILKIFPYGEKLLVFRERAIMTLTAYADPLDFKLKRACFERETIMEESIALCGDVVYFCTDGGLRKFDGQTVSAVETDPRVVFSDKVYGGSVNGAYYASVPTADGKRAVFTLSSALRGGRLLGITHDKGCMGRKFYVQIRDAMYSLGGRALPAGGGCTAEFALSLSPQCDGEKFVEGVIVEGKGDFTVELTGDDAVHRVSGRAGKRLRFPKAVRGNAFGLKVTAKTEDFVLYAVTLCVRREELHDD